jgi:hypothetical protein
MKINVSLQDLNKVFFLMETQEKLFSLKTEDGQYIWNSCRYEIFNLLFSMHKDDYINNKIEKNTIYFLAFNKIKNYIRGCKSKLINFLSLRYILKKKPEYIFITCQKTRVGVKIKDSITDHLIEILTKNSISIEIMNRQSISYIRMLIGLNTRIPPVAYVESMNRDSLIYFSDIINKAIKKYFGHSVEINDLLNKSFSRQRENFKYFAKIISNYSPKAIIGVNDNNLNGLYAAAKKYKIPTIELQHGASNEHTILWSYPKSIDSSHLGLSLPDAYFTFSDYWMKNTNYPVRMMRAIGNDNLYQKLAQSQSEAVLIISTYMHHDALIDLTMELGGNVNKKIYFKLHPHEYYRKKETIKKFCKLNNVEIITDELNFDKLFNLCSHVVVVHSSSAYQALQAGKCVCVYIYYNYFFHSDIYEYVRLFKNSAELIELIDEKLTNLSKSQKVSSIPLFYSRLKIDTYLAAVKDVEELA